MIIGDFSARGDDTVIDISELAPYEVHDINDVLGHLNLKFPLLMDNVLFPTSTRALELKISIQSTSDFLPDAIISNTNILREYYEMMQQLMAVSSEVNNKNQATVKLTSVQKRFVQRFVETEQVTADDLQIVLAEAQQRLIQQVNRVIHHPVFQALEARWRGVAMILNQMADANIGCSILDVTKATLIEDFIDSPQFDDSRLYRIIYSEEYGQYGGQPYGAIIGTDYLTAKESDIKFLEHVAHIAKVSHAPYIAPCETNFLGYDIAFALPGLMHIQDVEDEPRLRYWRAFREKDVANYVSLVLPRIQLRQPYDYKTFPFLKLPFVEKPNDDETEGLWGPASLAFASCLIRSFKRYRFCYAIVGETGGMIEEEGVKPELLLSEHSAAQLTAMGFIPLSYNLHCQTAHFHSAVSLRYGALPKRRAENINAAALGERLGTELPYLFLVCRFSQYMKVIQRDTIGSSQSLEQLKAQLNAWLQKYVADVENPSAMIRSKHPLRKAELEIYTLGDEPDRLGMRLNIMPHMKHFGSEYSLSFEGLLRG